MMQRSTMRALLGIGIGAFAGISLTTGVLPFVITRLFGINSFEILIMVSGFTLPAALLWAVGGGIVGWEGGTYTGSLVFGACGAISGFILGTFALGGSLPLVIAGLLSGLVYGVIGGVLIGHVFPKSIGETQ